MDNHQTNKGRKYSPELADRLIGALRELGSARAAYNALGVSKYSFYDWIKRFPDFAVRVEVAKREYFQNQDRENVDVAKKIIENYLVHGDVTEKKIIKQVIDRDGNIVELTEKHLIRSGCPEWVIRRVLGEKMQELEAVKVLVDTDWLPESLLVDVQDSLTDFNSTIKNSFQNALNPPDTKGIELE